MPAGTRLGDAEKLISDLIKRKHEAAMVTDKVTVGSYLIDRWLPVQQAQLRASKYES